MTSQCIWINTSTGTQSQHFNISYVDWACVWCIRRSVVLRTPYNDTIHWGCLVDDRLRQFLPSIDDCSFQFVNLFMWHLIARQFNGDSPWATINRSDN